MMSEQFRIGRGSDGMKEQEHEEETKRRVSPDQADAVVQHVPEVDSYRRVVVAGDLVRTLADFERACLVHLYDEQQRPNPNNALIAVLCDAVRLKREHLTALASPVAVEPHQQEAVIQYLRNKLTNHDGPPAGAYLRQWLCELTPRGAALSPAREQEAPKGPVSFWANKYLLEKSDHAVTADQLATLTSSLADAEQQLEVLRPGGLYAWKSKYEALTSSLAEFVERCEELRNGSPNRFYAHVDSFCRAVSGPVK